MSYDISEEDRGLLGIDGLAFGEKDPNKVYMLAGTEYFSNGYDKGTRKRYGQRKRRAYCG